MELDERYFTTGEYTDKSHRNMNILLIGFIIANVVWFSFILIISEFEAWGSVIFWAIFQSLFFVWLYALFKFGSTHKIDRISNAVYIHGKKVPISSIQYVEVIHFTGTYDSLAIGYTSSERKPVITLTGGGKKFDIMEFCNILRELKGWDKMEHPKDYGSRIFGYYKWKNKIKDRMLENI
jgi:hypothetical protein